MTGKMSRSAYLCVHCDHRWEDDGEEPPRRCPSCMRATGVEPVKGQSAEAAQKPSRVKHYVFATIAFLVVALIILLVARRTDEPNSGLAPQAPSALKAALLKEQVDAAGLEQLFASNAAMESYAEKAVANADGPIAKAKALHDALRARASALAFVPWSLSEPRGTPVMVATETFDVVQKDKERAHLYPLELAVLEAALLRAVDVPAMVAELIQVPGERAPLDPSGYLGYYVTAVYESKPGVGAPALFDPYGGRSLNAEAKYQVLSDKQVVAGLLALRAIFEMAYLADPRAALQTSGYALALATNLPSVRTARGVIVLGGGMVEQGLQELTAARQMRADAPRMHNLASALLMTGDSEGAERELQAALEKAPDFAAAHATLATFMTLKGDNDTASAELARAEDLAPDLSLVWWAKAERMLRDGEKAGAVALAERALKAGPSFDARLRYGMILRQAGKYEDMRKVAHELVALAPSYRKSELEDLIKRALGPTALDPIEPDPSADDLQDLGGPDLDLKLDKPKLLGDSRPPEPKQAEPGEPLILLGDPSKLRLRGSSEDLKLKLDP